MTTRQRVTNPNSDRVRIVSQAKNDASTPVRREVAFQKLLLELLLEDMEDQGYGPKGRSRWLNEAIAGLIIHDPEITESGVSDRLPTDDPSYRRVRRTISLNPALSAKVDQLAEEVLFRNPGQIGPHGYIARSAVRHRLGRPELYTEDATPPLSQLIDTAIQVPIGSDL